MNRNLFAWLDGFPTTAATCVIVLAVILLTALRYLFVGPPLPDLGAWLAFLGSLVTIVGGTTIGKRFATDPAVITAEAAATQSPSPNVSGPEITVIPQPGAVPGDPNSSRTEP